MEQHQSRRVNDILRNLRGEHFRHQLNVNGRSVTTALPPVGLGNSQGPTLPIPLIYGPHSVSYFVNAPFTNAQSRTGRPTAGTATPQKDGNDERTGRAWRIKALALMLSRLPSGYNPITHRLVRGDDYNHRDGSTHGHDISSTMAEAEVGVEPLTVLCLHALFLAPDVDDFNDAELDELVLPYLPAHVRRDLMRLRAVEAPLPNTRLSVLCNQPEGHIESELIVVGPQASLHRDYFRRHKHVNGNAGSRPLLMDASATVEAGSGRVVVEDEWDTDYDADGGLGGGGGQTRKHLGDDDEPIRTLILVSITITVPALLSLPPTLTHLALVDLKQQVPLNRLPSICPRLVVLDLSFNRWLAPPTTTSNGDGDGVNYEPHQAQMGRVLLGSVPWSRWADLQTLGLVECDVTPEVMKTVNWGRWNDVDIVH